MALLDRFLKRHVRRGVLTVIHPDGAAVSAGTPDPDFADVTLRFTDKGAERAILANPALGAAEMFMAGRLVIEAGDIRALVHLLKGNKTWEQGRQSLEGGPLATLGRAIKGRVERINGAARAKRNVAHHYDLSDRLYDLFLDADRQYSCAYWTDPEHETLDRAQLDKKAHIAAKLALKPGMRVLDIGCGWGGMALYLNRVAGVEVLGITLSEEQLKVAEQRAADAGVSEKVKFQLIDYRALDGQFDRIVSVGMFEHVGPRDYRTYLAKCRDLLTDDGVMLLHSIGRLGGPGVTDAFTAKYIFPGGYNPALSEIVRANEGLRFMLTDVEVLRLHYAYTLDQWYDRAVAAKEQIVALYDERFYRMWTFYLAGAGAAFRFGGLVNYQLQFAKNRYAVPITRDYMVDEERRLGVGA
jgi:cyclopropane-fatty-acyl-phospholipid synthase